jgi:hypothetical protein
LGNHTWRYTEEDDLPNLREWSAAHGSADPVPYLPQVGILVDDCLAVFLYQTDSCICMIDAFVGKPGTPREEIKSALLYGCGQLMSIGRDMGYTRVLGLVDRSSTLAMAQELGGVVRDNITVLDGSL